MTRLPPRVRLVPPPEWETARLILRRPSRRDALAVQAAVEESFADLHRWMPWAAKRQTLRETRAYLERANRRFRAGQDYPMVGFLREEGRFVLGTGLHPRAWSVPSFEIGYWCRTSMQGCGFATEAVRSLVQLAFATMGAVRLEIRCDSRNQPSRRVAQRAGFHLEATLESEDRANDGSLRDTQVFVLFRSDAEPGQLATEGTRQAPTARFPGADHPER